MIYVYHNCVRVTFHRTDVTTSGLHSDPYDNWLYVAEGVKDIVLFSPAEAQRLELGTPVLDIRPEVEWVKGHLPKNRGPPSRGAAKKKKQEDAITMAWLQHFTSVPSDTICLSFYLPTCLFIDPSALQAAAYNTSSLKRTVLHVCTCGYVTLTSYIMRVCAHALRSCF